MGSVAWIAALACLGAGCQTVPRVWGDDVALYTMLSGGYSAVNQRTFDGHTVVGLEFVTHDPVNGWGYELGGSYGSEDITRNSRLHQAEFDELSLGVRRTWHPEEGATRTYVGFGGSVMRVEHTLSSPHDAFDDHGGGVYAHTGVLWNLGRYDFDRSTEILVGIDLRGLTGQDYDAVQLALVLGFGR